MFCLSYKRPRCPPILVKISWKLGKIFNFSFFNEQTNQLMNTQTKNKTFTVANLWYRPRQRCQPISVKKSWKLGEIFNFSLFKWTNKPTEEHINQTIIFHFSQPVREACGKMSTNFGRDILKTEQNIQLFHVLAKKWTNWWTHKPKILLSLENWETFQNFFWI